MWPGCKWLHSKSHKRWVNTSGDQCISYKKPNLCHTRQDSSKKKKKIKRNKNIFWFLQQSDRWWNRTWKQRWLRYSQLFSYLKSVCPKKALTSLRSLSAMLQHVAMLSYQIQRKIPRCLHWGWLCLKSRTKQKVNECTLPSWLIICSHEMIKDQGGLQYLSNGGLTMQLTYHSPYSLTSV